MKTIVVFIFLLSLMTACAGTDSKPDPKASYGGSYQIRGTVSSGTATGK